MRIAAPLLIVILVGYVALKLVFGVAGGLIGVLLSLAWFALKILLVVGLIYWLLSVFSPETAKKMRDSFRGTQL
ncbi:MAG TPA: hypothetical protein VLW85_22445 [Myxococcales bacterium]|nr:hypothetical protein [Myxococcales bacterium]